MPRLSSSSETAIDAPPRGPPGPWAGWRSMTSRVADSSRTPSGSPSGVRRMTPPDGSGVSRVTPAASRPAWLTRRAWWSCAQSAQRRPGATVSRSSAVGQPPQRSTSQPWPWSHAAGSVSARWAARTCCEAVGERRGIGQVDLAASTAATRARWRCASVRPGIATSSGSRAIRSVNGSARVSR